MSEDTGDNYQLKDITSRAELAAAMNATKGRVMILEQTGDLYKIRINNYVKDSADRRIRSDDEIYDQLKTEEKPFQIETIEGWVAL